MGELGDLLRVPVHVPQLLGASRISEPEPIFGVAESSSFVASGAWLQQSAVQWHSPAQQQKYSAVDRLRLVLATAPMPANCVNATSRETSAVSRVRVTIDFYTSSAVFCASRRFDAPGICPRSTNRRVEGEMPTQ